MEKVQKCIFLSGLTTIPDDSTSTGGTLSSVCKSSCIFALFSYLFLFLLQYLRVRKNIMEYVEKYHIRRKIFLSPKRILLFSNKRPATISEKELEMELERPKKKKGKKSKELKKGKQ